MLVWTRYHIYSFSLPAYTGNSEPPINDCRKGLFNLALYSLRMWFGTAFKRIRDMYAVDF